MRKKIKFNSITIFSFEQWILRNKQKKIKSNKEKHTLKFCHFKHMIVLPKNYHYFFLFVVVVLSIEIKINLEKREGIY